MGDQGTTPALLSAPLGEHLVLAQPHQGRLRVLDALGRWVWEAREAGIGTEETARLLAGRFGLPFAGILADVRALLGDWNDITASPLPGERPASPSTPTATAAVPPPPMESFPWLRGLRLGDQRVRLGIEDAEMARVLSPAISPLPADSAGTPDAEVLLVGKVADWRLYLDGKFQAQGDGADGAVVQVLSALVEAGCRSQRRLAVLHAAGVVWQGRGILLIGRGGSGKTTLAAALQAQPGFHLLEDDVVPLDWEGRLIGLGMSLCLKRGSWGVLDGRVAGLAGALEVERFGQRVRFVAPDQPWQGPPVPLATFIFPQYAPGTLPAVEPLSAVQVLQGIIEAEAVIPHLTQARLDALVTWVSSAPGYAVRYPDLAAAMESIRGLLSG